MKVKKILIALTLIFCISISGFAFFGCQPFNAQLVWTKIAEATLAEVTKADANFAISYIDSDVIVVDGNKMLESGTEYYVMEQDKIYEYSDSYCAVQYKTHQPGGYQSPATMGEWAAFTGGGLYVIKETLSSLQNVRALGRGKYSYFQDGYGSDPDTYTFTVTNGLVSEIEMTKFSGIINEPGYVTVISKYTYGGQTVTLPTGEIILSVKLVAPLNLCITDGVLTWDDVEGVKDYSAYIEKDDVFIYSLSRIDSAEIDFHYSASYYNWESGTYKITIWANHPNGNLTYGSSEVSIEYTYIRTQVLRP